MRIAIAQVNPTVGDLEGNLRLVEEYLRRATEAGAAVVAFPELVISGYPPEDLVFKGHFLERCWECVEAVAALTGPTIALVGAPTSGEGGVANSACVMWEGAVRAVYRKIWLPNYAVFDERRYFVPGNRVMLLETSGARLAVNVCEDIWNACGPTEEATLHGGAEIVINLSMSPFHLEKGRFRQDMIRTRALDSGAFVVYANGLGGQDELLFDGQSLVYSPEGDLIARGKHFEEELLVVDLDPAEARSIDGKGDAPGCWELDVVEVPSSVAAPPVARPATANLAPELTAEAEAYAGLRLGTRDYAEKNRFTGAVLGLSGGIDSALTACIAVDGLGADRVHLVSMPSHYTSSETYTDAALIAANLGAELIELPIRGIFDAYLETLDPVFTGLPADVTEENIQARIRGNLLMALSNKNGWLVLTTGNKSEMAVGYATLYGDMAGGFAVLKDVPKTLVYRVARYRNARTPDRPPIPDTVLTRPPSAELRPGQTDQENLPPYDVLDRIVEEYVVQDRSATEIAAMGLPGEDVERIIALIDGSEHKRRQAPPGVRITSKAFGKDRRLPITNRFRERGGTSDTGR